MASFSFSYHCYADETKLFLFPCRYHTDQEENICMLGQHLIMDGLASPEAQLQKDLATQKDFCSNIMVPAGSFCITSGGFNYI